jgi:hypothetical protein
MTAGWRLPGYPCVLGGLAAVNDVTSRSARAVIWVDWAERAG